MNLLVIVENAAVARLIYKLVKDRYKADLELFVKKKMNLKKNRVYGIRIMTHVRSILEDLGLYSARGLLDKPLLKIVQYDSNARAYLAGAFMASGSINSPEKANYHLEIAAVSDIHADFLIQLLSRFAINGKMIERRGKTVVYVKAAEKIADFLRIIEANEALMKFENVRISRDFANSLTRLNNMDVANEVKTQTAALKQLEDIRILEEGDKIRFLDQKIVDVIELRKEFPESSLNELAEEYEKRTGIKMSKSGLKHRFVKIHDLAVKGVSNGQ